MTFFIALVLVIVSGAMAGNVLTPIKFMRKYRFENYWLIHSLVGTVILPWSLAIATIPDLFGIYSHLPWSTLLVPPLFAFSWGIASTLGGLCASRIGLSLTYALIIGVGAATGTLVPLLYFSPETFTTSAGKFIVLGVLVMVVGLILIARAGRAKETREKSIAAGENRSAERGETIQGSFLAGLIMALLAGLLSAGLNFSFAFGQRITAAAVAAGASPGNATYAVWPLAMLGGMVPNLAWAAIGLVRNKSWHQFIESADTDFPLAALMGILFMGSTATYGLGAIRLGILGASVGWGIMQIMQIVAGNAAGFLSGEWRIAGRAPVRIMFTGLGVLILASVLLACGNYLAAPGTT